MFVDLEVNLLCGWQCALGHEKKDCPDTSFVPFDAEEELREKGEYCAGKASLSLFSSVTSVAQSCPTLCDPVDCSMPGLSVHHQLLEFTQTHVHQVGDTI